MPKAPKARTQSKTRRRKPQGRRAKNTASQDAATQRLGTTEVRGPLVLDERHERQ